MLKFKRLSDLSKDEKVIVEALKKSKAGLLEVSEDGSKIRRDPAIPLPENTEESRKLLEARTAYAKGFNKESSTLDELIEYFNESNPDVVSIQMRNYCEKKGKDKVWKFKGSIFLTFKTDEERNKFGKSNSKKPKAEGADDKEEVEVKQEEEFTLPKGSVLKLTGLGGEITREDIKEVLKDQCSVNIDKDGGDIAFVTYEKGEAEAKIRFKNEDGAKAPAAAWVAKDKVEIKGMTIVGSLLEGEEEDQFLKDSAQDLKNRRNKNKGQKFGQKRRGGGHHGHGGKRGRR